MTLLRIYANFWSQIRYGILICRTVCRIGVFGMKLKCESTFSNIEACFLNVDFPKQARTTWYSREVISFFTKAVLCYLFYSL
jgi:hypothetical protein